MVCLFRAARTALSPPGQNHQASESLLQAASEHEAWELEAASSAASLPWSLVASESSAISQSFSESDLELTA